MIDDFAVFVDDTEVTLGNGVGFFCFNISYII
jgi:hypothetical protein